MNDLYLLIAIVAEVIGTSALKACEGFTRLMPSLLVVAGYAVAFIFLSLAVRTIPLALAYAVWSGTGVVLIAIASWIVFGQSLDFPAIVGLTLIVTGVAIVNLLSKTVSH